MLRRQRPSTASTSLLLGLVLSGCFTITELDVAAEGSTSSAGDSTTGPQVLPTGMTTVESNTSSSSSGFGTETGSSAEDSGCLGGFIPSDCGPDVPHIAECNLWDDDCPRGEKCTIWANDGGAQWNDSRCVPLAPDPAGPGEPCTSQGPGLSGFDDCDAGSVCRVWESGTLQGTCMPMCVGSPEAPECEDPGRVCSIGGNSIPAFCIERCHPLDLASCPRGSACYPSSGGTTCAPDASGPDLGALFDPCEFTNACDPGLACLQAGLVGACSEGAGHCCTPWCDLEAPSCPETTTCIPAYAGNNAPPGQENVGLCGQETSP